MKLTLKVKAILMIVMICLLIGVAGVVVCNRSIHNLITEEYETRSMDIVHAMAEILDADQVKTLRDAVWDIYEDEDEVILSNRWGTPEFEAYVSHYSEIEQSETFLSLREQLRKVQDVIDVDCLYIIWFDIPQKRYIYLVDAAYEGACPPGCVDPIYKDISPMADIEEYCLPNVTHTDEYGYLVTTAKPIRTADGQIVGFAAVDLSMNEIIARQSSIMTTLLLTFGLITALISLIGIIIVDRSLVRHINKLSETAEKYTANDLHFSQIEIHTGDEIETLANSMKRMEQDIKNYYNSLLETTSDLERAKENAEEFKREANIDPLTHLRNKRAYDLFVANLDTRSDPYAIVMIDLNDLKGINDQYGHEKGDIAIQNLAKLICKVFKNSPVFRIGGDEFVVIMTDDDYEIHERVIERFRDEIRALSARNNLKPWEKPCAACGYAVHDKHSDEGAAGVFKRADKNMYMHKTTMKKDHYS